MKSFCVEGDKEKEVTIHTYLLIIRKKEKEKKRICNQESFTTLRNSKKEQCYN